MCLNEVILEISPFDFNCSSFKVCVFLLKIVKCAALKLIMRYPFVYFSHVLSANKVLALSYMCIIFKYLQNSQFLQFSFKRVSFARPSSKKVLKTLNMKQCFAPLTTKKINIFTKRFGDFILILSPSLEKFDYTG